MDMSSIQHISARLRDALAQSGLTQQELRKSAGISRQTLANVLKGIDDYKLSTLLGLVDRLGLELVLLPKAASRGLPPPSSEPVVETMVDRVRKQLGAAEPIHPAKARKP